MATMRIKTDVTVAGITSVSTVSRTAEQIISQDFSDTLALPAADAGVITRSDANTGVVTLTTGHGITTGMKLDVYWDGGIRRGMDATVSVNACTVDGGAGDDLPATAATPVTVSVQVPFAIAFDGDSLEGLAIINSQRVSVELTGSLAGADGLDLPAGEGMSWASGTAVANPCAGDTITAGICSCGSTDGGTLQIIALIDNA